MWVWVSISAVGVVCGCGLHGSIRDGVMVEMMARWLVPGEIVHIALGDRVPADIRLIEVGVSWGCGFV